MDTYASESGGNPGNIGGPHTTGDTGSTAPWHRRISSEAYLWLIVVGSIGALWLLAGSFRRNLS